MVKKSLLLSLAVALGLSLGCEFASTTPSMAAKHPQQLSAGRPQCTECHTTEAIKSVGMAYAAFDHTATFVKDHKHVAKQEANMCASCHAPSFCSDCHGGKAVMAPSTKLSERPDRGMPHRGNYMTLHRIDGKIDPTGCYKCHGRANNDKCGACHK